MTKKPTTKTEETTPPGDNEFRRLKGTLLIYAEELADIRKELGRLQDIETKALEQAHFVETKYPSQIEAAGLRREIYALKEIIISKDVQLAEKDKHITNLDAICQQSIKDRDLFQKVIAEIQAEARVIRERNKE